MKHKIIISWPVREDTSLGIYTQHLIDGLSAKYDIQDERRNITGDGFWKNAWLAIKDFGKTTFPIKWSKDDILLAPNTSVVFPTLFLFAKAKKVHIVHDCFMYDDDYYDLWTSFQWRCVKWYYQNIHKFLYGIAFRKADVIVAISEATKDDLIAKFGTKIADKIVVIYNGVDTKTFQAEQIFPKFTPEQDQKYILYIGSELGRKNVPNIIAGFSKFQKKHPEYILLKAPIEKTKTFRDATLEAVHQNNLTIGKDIVFFDRYLDIKEIVSLYQHTEVFLFPTLKEGFGFPILEAALCGAPVITTNRKPMSELIFDKNQTVDPENPSDIADKLEILCLLSAEQKAENRKQSIAFAKKFDWKYTIKKFDDLFQKLTQ